MFSLLLITASLIKAEDKRFYCAYNMLKTNFVKENVYEKVHCDHSPGLLVTFNPDLRLSVATGVFVKR